MNYYNYSIVILLNSIFIYLFLLQYFDHPASFKLNSIYKPKINTTVVSRCPKIIHQIVPDINNVPSGLYHTILHNIKMNPEFEYRIYDYNSAYELLKKDFSSKEGSAYLSSNNNQIKTDYIKYAFIYKYGGLFLDIKYICMYKFIDLLKYNNVFFVQLKGIDDMDLSLLVSHPDNPAIESSFKIATDNLSLKIYPHNLDRITGGSIIRDELFMLGYLADYTKVDIDSDHIVRMKHTQAIICKKYTSYDKENNSYHLLPDITIDFQEKILYNNDLINKVF
jgi:mannosyltransferase OCH1-like enzyme